MKAKRNVATGQINVTTCNKWLARGQRNIAICLRNVAIAAGQRKVATGQRSGYLQKWAATG